MRLHLLLLKNNVLVPEIEKAKEYLEQKLGIKVELDIKDSDIEITDYKQALRLRPDGKPQYTIAGLGERLRVIVPANTYHIVGFLFRNEKTDLIAHSYSSLYGGTDKTLWFEAPMSADSEYNWESIAHEVFHCLFGRALVHGVPLDDPMDTLPLSMLGHANEALARLKPHFGVIFAETPVFSLYGVMLSILGQAISLLGKLLKKKQDEVKVITEVITLPEPNVEVVEPIETAQSKLLSWARAIEQFENFRKDYNNPGAIRGLNGKFLQFPTHKEGMEYLLNYLERVATGKHKAYPKGGEHTLLEFQKIYSPSTDHNDPLNYARFVAGRLGVSINQKIKTFV